MSEGDAWVRSTPHVFEHTWQIIKRPHRVQTAMSSKPFYQLEFDHMRGKKQFNISQAGVSVKSFPLVLEEIQKMRRGMP